MTVHEGNEIEITVDVDDSASSKFRHVEQAAMQLGDIAGRAVEGIAGALASTGIAVGDFGAKMLTAGVSTAAMGAASTAATGGMNLLIGAVVAAAAAIPALIGGFLALAPALFAVGGAAGAAIAGLAGVVGIGATLKLGLGGVGDAWDAYQHKATAGGGASAAAGKQAEASAKQLAAAEKQVEQAEWSLTQAKRQATEASKDVTRARDDELERLEDLELAIRGQKFAQEDANEALQAALEKRAQAYREGTNQERVSADKAVERAQYQYDYETERIEDLKKDKAEADRKGVDGSDQVQAALTRQREASERVTQAAAQLADAHKAVAEAAAGPGGAGGGGAAGGVDRFAQAMAKLSPNARSFVRTLIDLQERLDAVKRKVQDRLFDGLDKALENLAGKWLPKLPGLLGDVADSLNSVIKGVMDTLGRDDVMKGFSTAVKATSDLLKESIGPALDHVIHALAMIAGKSSAPLQKIGDFIERIAEKFDDWVTSAAESGELKTFMESAAASLQQIWDIGGQAFDILTQIVDILFPASDEASGGVLEAVSDALTKIQKWLANGSNQKKLREWVDDFVGFIKFLSKAAGYVDDFGQAWVKIQKPVWKAIGIIWDAMSVASAQVRRIGGNIIEWFHGMPRRLSGAFRGMWDGLKDGFRNALNWLIGKWNGLQFTMPGIFGGGTIGVPPMRYLATGGAAGGLAMVGERGAELVRLPYGSSVMPAGDTARALAGGGGGSTDVTLRFDPSGAPGLIAELVRTLRAEIRAQGGNVQQVLGVAGR